MLLSEFLVLAKSDGSDRTLVCIDQRGDAGDHGFTVEGFSVVARTRGPARRAWDSERTGREIADAGMETDNDFGLERLPEQKLVAVATFVTALVERNRSVLAASGVYDFPTPTHASRRVATAGGAPSI